MSNAPVLIAYTVRDRGPGDKRTWTRIGAAWPHDKGSGLTVVLEALPLTCNERIVLLEPNYELPDPNVWFGPPPN